MVRDWKLTKIQRQILDFFAVEEINKLKYKTAGKVLSRGSVDGSSREISDALYKLEQDFGLIKLVPKRFFGIDQSYYKLVERDSNCNNF